MVGPAGRNTTNCRFEASALLQQERSLLQLSLLQQGLLLLQLLRLLQQGKFGVSAKLVHAFRTIFR